MLKTKGQKIAVVILALFVVWAAIVLLTRFTSTGV